MAGSYSSTLIHKRGYAGPLFLYSLKDRLSKITQRYSFFDAVLVVFTFLAASAALPFYPIPLLVLLFIALFGLTLYHPFIGIIALLFLIVLQFMYQVPLISTLILFAIVLTLIFGYMHYRTLLFMYALIALSFSNLGYLLAIPTFAIGILVVGRKRAIIITIAFVLAVVGLSGTMNVQNSSYILYNASLMNSTYESNITQSLHISKSMTSMQGFASNLSASFSAFSKGMLSSSASNTATMPFFALAVHPIPYILQLALFIVLIILVDSFASSSRMQYKGSISAALCIAYPLITIGVAAGMHLSVPYPLFMFISAIIAPFFVYALEVQGISIVKSLDVKKQDIRMKFGDAFEDMQTEGSNESFSDIGDYESVKRELIDSIINPIEEKGIANVYGIKPTKGILLFGPPGTGKTLIMRALAKETRSGFYYVKSANLVSSVSGDTAKAVQNIFAIAKKHQPCILFFDEIDAITGKRESGIAEATHEALTQLLVEMDGFQKTDKIIVIGATNAPNMIDPALLRTGRFDKAIYMPLPDEEARKQIFAIYLKNFPLADDINLDELSKKTERFSGSDIKEVCTAAAQAVAEEAISKKKVINITQADLLKVISATKPSTSLAQLEKYNTFKLDFERSLNKEAGLKSEEENNLSLENVIGMDEAKKALIDAIQIPLLHPDLVEKYAVKSIKGVLLFGPPGCGKTLLMKAAINDSSLRGTTMLSINGAELSNGSVDDAVNTIHEIFNRARENQPAIIFIDEIDGIVPQRSEGNPNSKLTTSLLTEMDGIGKSYGVVVVAATNKPDALDPALLRPGRFDKLVFIKPPNAEQRVLMFKENLKGVPIENIDFQELSRETEGYTGADIANLCREAKSNVLEKAVNSAKEVAITMDDFTNALAKIRPSAPQSVLNQYLSFLARFGQR